MGTRADFYVGRGTDAEWLGSIAWDGYPAGIDESVLLADNIEEYRRNVSSFLEREDGTLPTMGWPWPWDDSGTTDYAYAFDAGLVYASSFGGEWFEVDLYAENGGEPDAENHGAEIGSAATFPNMSERRNMALGSKRSGMIIIGPGVSAMIPAQRQAPEPHTPPAAPEPRQFIATTASGAQLLVTVFPDDGPPRVQMRIGQPFPSSLGSWAPGYVVAEVAS